MELTPHSTLEGFGLALCFYGSVFVFLVVLGTVASAVADSLRWRKLRENPPTSTRPNFTEKPQALQRATDRRTN